MRYMVVIERGEKSWGAHVPDLPGCVAVGETRNEVLRLIREAIGFHIEGLRHDGLPAKNWQSLKRQRKASISSRSRSAAIWGRRSGFCMRLRAP